MVTLRTSTAANLSHWLEFKDMITENSLYDVYAAARFALKEIGFGTCYVLPGASIHEYKSFVVDAFESFFRAYVGVLVVVRVKTVMREPSYFFLT